MPVKVCSVMDCLRRNRRQFSWDLNLVLVKAVDDHRIDNPRGTPPPPSRITLDLGRVSATLGSSAEQQTGDAKSVTKDVIPQSERGRLILGVG